MATLKQILIALTAAAVGVLASPLAVSADAAAPTSVSAPKPAVTEIGKPLEGKALEEYLAHGPYVPEGSIDITNTTLAAELTKFYEAQHKGGLAKRGGCSQGDCPDFFAAFDLLEQHIVAPVWGSPVNYWAYWGRWNDCGQCGKVQTSSDGCFDFTSCGRPQTICIDRNNGRAHRIWRDIGAKSCYSIKAEYFTDACPPIAATNLRRPTGQVACNW